MVFPDQGFPHKPVCLLFTFLFCVMCQMNRIPKWSADPDPLNITLINPHFQQGFGSIKSSILMSLQFSQALNSNAPKECDSKFCKAFSLGHQGR